MEDLSTVIEFDSGSSVLTKEILELAGFHSKAEAFNQFIGYRCDELEWDTSFIRDRESNHFPYYSLRDFFYMMAVGSYFLKDDVIGLQENTHYSFKKIRTYRHHIKEIP